MKHRFLALPVRPALAGVSWASLSVSILPTEEQKRGRRIEAEQSFLFDLVKPEKRPSLHPVGGRRLPVERFWYWTDRANKTSWSRPFSTGANNGSVKPSSAAGYRSDAKV